MNVEEMIDVDVPRNEEIAPIGRGRARHAPVEPAGDNTLAPGGVKRSRPSRAVRC